MTATTTLKKILDKMLQSPRCLWITGGQSSAKTYSSLIYAISFAQTYPNSFVVVSSAELTKLKNGPIRQFKTILQDFERFSEAQFIGGVEYRFLNGSVLKFISMDKDDAFKGVRADLLLIDEVNKINREQFVQSYSRARKVITTWNPDAPFFYESDFEGEQGHEFLRVTYKDNEMCPSEERQVIESYWKMYQKTGSQYWLNKHRVYALGETGIVEGQVFENYTTHKEAPKELQFKAIGVDFGFANDPTAIVGVGILNGAVWLVELKYKTGMHQEDIAHVLEPYKDLPIVCDAAEPMRISDLRRSGLKAIPADKRNREAQIDKMRALEVINIVGPGLCKEFESYRISEKGRAEGTDDAIDASRYGLGYVMKWGERTGSKNY